MPYEIPVVFDNGSDYDYHFIIKESASNWENLDIGGKIQKGTKAFLFQTKKKLQKLIKIEIFFSIIIKMYIDSLVTKTFKIKVNKLRNHRTQNFREDIYCLL